MKSNAQQQLQTNIQSQLTDSRNLSNAPATRTNALQAAKTLQVAGLASQYGLGHSMDQLGQGKPYGGQ